MVGYRKIMKLEEIQKIIHKYNCDGLLISNFDRFFSEYVAGEDNELKKILGFSGSNGIGVVIDNAAHIFTDGRYELQAKQQVPEAVIHISPESNLAAWIKEQTEKGKKFAFNPNIFRYLTLAQAKQENLITCGDAIIGEIMGEGEGNARKQNIFILDEQYAGEAASVKLDKLKLWFEQQNTEYFIIEDCDSVAWLLNLRGDYYEFNPTVAAKLIFSKQGICLFIENAVIKSNINRYLNELGIEVESMDEFYIACDNISGARIISENSCSCLVKNISTKNIASPIIEWKSSKNSQEILSAVNAHKQDARALNEFILWFRTEFSEGRFYSEYELSHVLQSFRKKQPDYFSDSFPAIIGFQDNGAVIHYRPLESGSKLVKGDGLLLIDSGGQYFGGTTDVTRTYAVGNVSDEQKRNYTLVLKGHIAAASKIFDHNTTGADIDKLARQYLVQEGLDYQHGTGHGVGSFLNVHEGPYSISKYSKLPLKENLILSIEPGYYKAGEYGIRIENLYRIKANIDKTLYFEPLTLLPFEDRLIDFSLISPDELDWLKSYNEKISLLNL